MSHSPIITDEFVKKYIEKQPNWGFNGLGYVVYKRTYSRNIGEDSKEEWPITIQRCINGAQKIGANYTQEEAERLFDHMFHLRCNMAGRFLWQLGTPTVDRFGANSLLNCLRGDTKVLTRQGWREISTLAGSSHEIVTTNGKWVEAPFKSYGKQQLMKTVFSDRYGSQTTVYSTPNHRWFTMDRNHHRSEVHTEDLVPGDRVPLVRGKNSSKQDHRTSYCNTAKVVSNEMTDLVEEVYCAEVPETHAFVIDGNILTGNCWFAKLSEPSAFTFLFENLMLGGGVGFSIRREDVHELPRIKRNVSVKHSVGADGRPTKDADFIVPDSREGWVKLLELTLDAYFTTGKSFTYSTILVRGAGEAINGFGGTASGPGILIDGIKKITDVLKSREGKKLRSLDALDLCNILGSIVVAGNVRRSAEIALGDPDDFLFLRAKRWDLGNIPNYRAMSNNTMYADSYDQLSSAFWEGYEGNGEPYGLFNLPLSEKYGRLVDGPMAKSDMYPQKRDNVIGTNPCQPGWAPVLTKDGIRRIEEIGIGDEIWSERGWTKVVNKWSNGIKPVYKYTTTSSRFYGTENHRLVSNGVKVEAKDCESVDTLTGPSTEFIVSHDPQTTIDGICIGDGMVHKASGNLRLVCIGQNDGDYLTSEVAPLIGSHRPGISEYAYEVSTTLDASEFTPIAERVIPDRYYSGTPEVVCSFLRGLYSANGSVCGNRITLKATSLRLIEQVQDMLSSIGIRSYYTTNKPSNVQFANGEYTCKQSYDLNISTDREKFLSSIGFIQQYKNEKVSVVNPSRIKTTYEVVSVELVSEEEVFDITVENDTHTYWTSGSNVSNCGEISLADRECCCLSELYLNRIVSQEQMLDCAKLLYKTQKAICALNFIHPETNKIVHKNMRVGLGVTGVCQSKYEVDGVVHDKLDWLDGVYRGLRAFDKEYSKANGFSESIKLTTVKPSGTLSILAGSSPGVHPAFSRYFIRRVRMSASDQLVTSCRELGYHTEYAKNFDGTEDHGTVVVSFPCQFDDQAIVAAEMTAIDQLNLVKRLQSEWADNAVSCTVYYRPEELPAIKEWLAENYENSIKSVSFLLHSDHGFAQAPYEEITRETYEKLVSEVKPLTTLSVSDLGSATLEGVECAGGACPIR